MQKRVAEEWGLLPLLWGRKWWHKGEVGQESLLPENKEGESINPACYSTKEVEGGGSCGGRGDKR